MRIVTIVFALLAIFAETSAAQDFATHHCECCREGRRAGEQYHPQDPWNRGRIWLRQTGHFGKFYNCDCEENKRNSPYICWKKSDSPFPGGHFFESIKCDWQRMKQRIADGSRCCDGNRCRKAPGKSCHCRSCTSEN